MAPKDRKTEKQKRLEQTRARIWGARGRLQRSILGPLLDHIPVYEREEGSDFPLIACSDPLLGHIWVNPYKRSELGEAEWTFIIGHQLLHLGLNHLPRRLHRDPQAWNLACEHAVDNLL